MTAFTTASRISTATLSFLSAVGAQAWQEVSTAQSPSLRQDPAMAFHESSGEIVLFGGSTQPSGGTWRVLGDTWTFDGSDWRQETPVTSPPARAAAVMGYDPISRRVVMVGGSHDGARPNYRWDAWAWDGSDWTQLPDLPAFTDTRTCGGGAFDPGLDGLVITSNRDTILLRNGGWTTLGAAPNPPNDCRLFYDPTRDALLAISRAWYRWDRNAAVWVTVPSRVIADLDNGLGAMDPFTGDATFLYRGWTSRWNIDGWRVLRVAAPAHNLTPGGALVFDSRSRRMIAVGKGGPNDQHLKTWELDETSTPPEFRLHGTGCGSPSTAPLTMQVEPTIGALPYLGGWLGFRIEEVPTFQPLFFIVGFDDSNWNGLTLPLDLSSLGMTGCTLRSSIEIIDLVGIGPSARVLVHALPIPNQAGLIGLQFHLQYLSIAPGANPAGAILSNAGTGRIGL